MFSKMGSNNRKGFPIHGWYLYAAIALVLSGVITATGALASKPSSTSYSSAHNAAAPQAPRSTSLVISQVYAGGGNSGAPFHNDFVELFNPTASTVSFTNWSIQYQSATGAGTWQVNPITGTIPAGGYFLVQLAAGAGGGAALPTPDAIGTTNMGATAGKVALVNTITGLPCSSACHGDPTVVDYVGYGTTANDWEGFPNPGSAPAPSNTSSDVRVGNGCQDTDNNAADFLIVTDPNIVPRNSASPRQPCATPTLGPSNTPSTTRTPTSTPTAFPTCGPGSDYLIIPSTGATIVPGVDDTGSHCSGCTTQISLPFPVRVYGIPFTTVNASNTGNLQFLSTNGSFSPDCLPDPAFNYAIFPYWVDQNTVNTGSCTTCGIFTTTTGSAPNRVFNIEWRTVYYGTTIPVNYEVQFLENSDTFNVIYGSAPDNGSSATTIGVQRGTGISYTQYYCGSVTGQPSGLMLTFRPLGCGEPTFTPTATSTSTNTPTPVPTCGVGSDYVITSGAGAIVPGTTDIGNHCNSCITVLTLPFTYNFYGLPFNTANISSKGTMQFISASTAFSNVCLPTNSFNYALMPYWDDLRTDSALTSTIPSGIFTSVSGSAPNRVFNVEWRACIYTGNFPCDDTDTNFEVRLHEGSRGNFEYVYGAMLQNGSGATVGVQRSTGQSFTQFSCNTASLSSGLQLSFDTVPCSTPTSTPTQVAAGVITGHLTWQGIGQATPNPRNTLVTGTLTICTGSTANNFTFHTDASGNFTVTTGLPDGGPNTWIIKGPRHLATRGSVTISGGVGNIGEAGLQRGGDVVTTGTNNNIINASDFNTLKSNFGQGGDRPSDIDFNNVTNASDFNILKGNFGQAGAALTCP